ncbi:DinB family protein [Spirosoma aerophilum]
MQPPDKASWLASLDAQVAHHTQEALEHFQNLDEGLLCRPSSTGGWSIVQCLAHLNSYGDYYFPYLQQGLERPASTTSSDPYTGSWLGTYLIRMMDPDRSRIKFKAFNRHQPTEIVHAPSVVAAFIDQQAILQGLLKRAQQADVNTLRIPLSIAPFVRLSAGDILEFLVVHTKRHLLQAKRNM